MFNTYLFLAVDGWSIASLDYEGKVERLIDDAEVKEALLEKIET